MPRKAGKVPSYCRHKASGQAVVRIKGRDHYLGAYGSAESHQEYEKLISEWRADQQQANKQRESNLTNADYNLTISQVLYRYREFARAYYSKDGQPTKEYVEMKYALRPVRKLYGSTLREISVRSL